MRKQHSALQRLALLFGFAVTGIVVAACGGTNPSPIGPAIPQSSAPVIQAKRSVAEMIAAGDARYVCNRVGTAGRLCSAIAMTESGLTHLPPAVRRAHPAPPRSADILICRVCQTPLPTLPPTPAFVSNNQGMSPADFESAYNLPVHGGTGKTVAVIEMAHDVSLESDLDIYREQFGIPVCVVRTGCLRIVDDSGGSNYPAPPADDDDEETALDVDMVSAICPDCNILVVETPETYPDAVSYVGEWGKAVDTAVRLGANSVSLSLAADERALLAPGTFSLWPLLGTLAPHFNHPGVPITASSGDSGFNGGMYPNYPLDNPVPADFPTVVAVGGTELWNDQSTQRGWSESAWSDGGSGCSVNIHYAPQYQPIPDTVGFPAPSFQTTNTWCGGMRAVPDISFAADIAYGGAFVYVSHVCPTCRGGWDLLGGTSEGAPAIAAMYMLDSIPNTTAPGLGTLYTAYQFAPQLFWDITSGTNSTQSCSLLILCNAFIGPDGPTGLGTPNGMHALDPFF